MKYFSKILATVALTATLFSACDKVDDLPVYGKGTASTLSTSAVTVAPLAADSNNVAVTFSWTNPKYASDSSTFKYVLQIDSTGRNFSKAISKTVIGTLKTSFLAKEFNAVLLSLGFAFNTPYDVDVRLISSYGNNNEQYKSNVLKLRVTPYVTPPKVTPPTTNRLFIVGNATPGSWTNPVPVPNQELSRIDSVTYGCILNLNGSSEYLLLPVNTNTWTTKFSVANKSLPGLSAGGDFGLNLNDNFPGPTAGGWYKMVYDFQMGRFTVTPFANPLAQDLYITGDGTPSNWTNTPGAAQKFTRLNNCEYEITMAFVPNKFYKFLSVSGQWQPQFGGSSATGGTLGANYGGGTDPDAVPTPTVAGNYKVRVNFVTNSYTVTKI
jgi:starch-binding outer membrane protein SusE/F